jgi:ligand-binding sensor domain-containing protein
MRQKLLPVLAALICSAAPMTDAFAQSSFWQKVDGPGAGCSAITIDRDNRIYVQTQDRMYRSHNGGESWSNDGSQVPGGASVLWTDARNGLYAGGMEAGGVYFSADNGATWSGTALEGVAVTSAALLPDGAMLLGTDGFGVYYSNDRGGNWAQLLDATAGGRVHAVAAAGNGDLLVATELSGILRSSDNGESWVDAGAGIPSEAVVDLAVDGESRIYAATRNKGIFVSTTNGDSWDLVGMAKWTIGSLAISKTGALYAAITSPEPALMRTTDRGVTWEEVATGLSSAVVHRVVFDNRGYMFAATTRGVFRSVQSTAAVGDDAVADGISGARLYPNPVALPQATLEVELKSGSLTTVSLVSSDGRVVATPYDGWLSAGTNRIAIDRNALAAGSYLCTIRTATGVISKQLVVE